MTSFFDVFVDIIVFDIDTLINLSFWQYRNIICIELFPIEKNMHCFDATPVLLIHCHIIYRANNSCSQGSQIWWHASPALHVCFLNQPNHCETIDRRSCKIYRILSVQSVWSDNPCIIHTTQTMYGELIAINDNLCLQWRAGTKAPLSTLNIDRQMCSRLARWYNCILLERAHCVQFINVMRAT